MEKSEDGSMKMIEVEDSEFEIEADLVLLAMGFVHPIHKGLVNNLSLKLDQRGNVEADEISFKTSSDKVFVAGDCRRGQSLVVWAISEGRKCAERIDNFLKEK